VLDITDLPDHGLVSVKPPKESELPDFVQEYLDKKKIKLGTGAVVVYLGAPPCNP
jgi:hypothetical protein